MKNNLHDLITATSGQSEFDNSAKILLGNHEILSQILKLYINELKDYKLSDIRYALKHQDEDDVALKLQFLPPKLYEPGRGWIECDLLMLVTTPETSFYVDIEAQRSATPGYQIVKRACFYVARILSWQQSQNFRISKDGKYDDLKKVYGIWVCMNNTEDRVVSLDPIPKALLGELSPSDDPDLCAIFMLKLPRICSVERGKTKGGVKRLNRILNVLLTNQLSETDKIEILRSEAVIVEEIKEDIHRMCNLSEMVFEDGVAHGMERGILIGTKDGMERGILIGTENGKTAERISIVKTQLSMKFKDVSFDWVSTLTQDKLDDIIKRIFDITFEEVMAMKSS